MYYDKTTMKVIS